MGELASAGQLRMSLLRWALVTVPLVVLLGLGSGLVANSGYGNPWFAALDKPAAMPPAAAFPIAWTILYVLMGLAVAIVLNARGARLRGLGLGLFALQLVLNLAWSPLFFRLHQVWPALGLIAVLVLLVLATTLVFARIRSLAGWLLVPYLAWLCFAAALNFDIARLNPDAASLAADGASTQISF